MRVERRSRIVVDRSPCRPISLLGFVRSDACRRHRLNRYRIRFSEFECRVCGSIKSEQSLYLYIDRRLNDKLFEMLTNVENHLTMKIIKFTGRGFTRGFYDRYVSSKNNKKIGQSIDKTSCPTFTACRKMPADKVIHFTS